MKFCYEKTMTGRWQPVVYHSGGIPRSVNGVDPERRSINDVPEDCIEIDGSPNFGKLTEKFK